MAIRKARFKPPVYDEQGTASYPDTVYFETSADMVTFGESDVAAELEGLREHLNSTMPHQFTDIQTGKTYQYGEQISADGKPQLIYKEVIQ